MNTVETFVIVIGLGVLGVLGLFALDHVRRHGFPFRPSRRHWLLIARLALTIPAAYGAFLSGVGLLFSIGMNINPGHPIDPFYVAYLCFLFAPPFVLFFGSIVTAWLPARGRGVLWTGIILQGLSLIPAVLLFAPTGTKAGEIPYVAIMVVVAWWLVHYLKGLAAPESA